MKEAFSPKLRLSKENKVKLDLVNSILEEYKQQGYVLTLRQLYYQLVSRDYIPNEDKEYKKLGVLLTEGRMAGIVDWDAIEDRVRVPYLPYWTSGPADAVRDVLGQYRINRMKGQANYIEVITEKDALSGILKRVTQDYHVNLMVNRGYTSTSAMYDMYQRFMKAIKLKDNKKIVVLYLGDHDASGLDMIRDIKDRVMEMLEVGYDKFLNHPHAHWPDEDREFTRATTKAWAQTKFEIKPIALTYAQVQQYQPPENPAKSTDPRAKWYREKYGPHTWEVDALNPATLDALVRSEIEKYVDMDLFNTTKDKEELDRRMLGVVAKKMDRGDFDEDEEEED